MTPPRRTRAPRSARRGMTLAELMVAIVVMSVGVLGLAASSAVVTRMIGGGASQTLAATSAQAHIEQLRSRPCAAMAGGVDTVRGIVTSWTTQPIIRGVSVDMTVQYNTVRGPRTRSYRSILPC
jgi:prepilin-type N-terminal cleavage/methylation domain-containing protein